MSGTKYKNALIVDDDVDLCLLLKAMLVTMIPVVECANSIKSGRIFLQHTRPDVIFLDNNLPDGRGDEFIKEIKTLSPNSLIVVISAIDNFKERWIEDGADVFLGKPLTYLNVTNALTLAGSK